MGCRRGRTLRRAAEGESMQASRAPYERTSIRTAAGAQLSSHAELLLRPRRSRELERVPDETLALVQDRHSYSARRTAPPAETHSYSASSTTRRLVQTASRQHCGIMDQHHPGAVGQADVLETPIWVLVVRIFQILLSVIILALAGRVAHDLYLDELGLAIAVPILTWIVVGYGIVTEKVVPWNVAYHVLAVLVLDGFMLVMWLATWAAVAAKRAQFKFPTQVQSCFDNGSIFGSMSCARKRGLELLKRDMLFKGGQNMMSAAAGLGALVWLLFIVTFVWTLVMFLRGRKDGRFPVVGGASSSTAHQTQSMVEQQQKAPVEAQPTGQHPPPAQSPYHQQSPYSPPPPGGAYSPPPQDQQQPFAQYPPQQYPSPGFQQTELSGQPPPQHTTPPSAATSPSPQTYQR
ncbi:hypothetical protein RJ55_04807 [Drechmeria coniospora]|nr:hypothetical protein RJ55_04807 [Drechmeria coniospora]